MASEQIGMSKTEAHREPLVKLFGDTSLKAKIRIHIGWAIIASLAIGWVLWMTLRPDSTVNSTNLVPFREHAQAVRCLLNGCPAATRAARFLFIDVLGNMLVFFPIGFSLVGALAGLPNRRRLRTAIALGAALSIGIEIIQLAIPSRATDVDDVVFNTIGTYMGAAFMVVTQRRLERNRD
jgi:glycopeptide antibiotics resistance protein